MRPGDELEHARTGRPGELDRPHRRHGLDRPPGRPLPRAVRRAVVGVASRARDDLHGIDELPRLLPSADAVVLLTPLADDTDVLVAEVVTVRLCAVLDVTDPEPLPDGHPLWTAPGALSITPHMAGDSPLGHRRAIDFAARQIAAGWRAKSSRPPSLASRWVTDAPFWPQSC